MSVEKYSASMDEGMLAEARAAALEEGLTLSGWLAEAVRDRLRLRGLRELVADYEAEHGEITAAELASVRKEISRGRTRRRSRTV